MEHQIVSFTLDAELEAKLQKLANEGWQLDDAMPPPIGVYHLVKMPAAATQAGLGTLTIDDNKVFILRNGKLIPG